MSYPKRRSFEQQLDSGDIVWVENLSRAADALLDLAGIVHDTLGDRLATYKRMYGRANVLTGDPFDPQKGHTVLTIPGASIGVYVSALAFNQHHAAQQNS